MNLVTTQEADIAAHEHNADVGTLQLMTRREPNVKVTTPSYEAWKRAKGF